MLRSTKLSVQQVRPRLRTEEAGFSLLETATALGVIFASLVVLGQVVVSAFSDIALARQRLTASQIANKVMEQVRGLPYDRLTLGLSADDQLAADPNIVSCADGALYYRGCPPSEDAERIVQASSLPEEVPLVPHERTYGPPEYPSTYTSRVYVTQAEDVPGAGAYRVTVEVIWSNPARRGVDNSLVTESLLFTPEGQTDAGTEVGSDAAFFYGTGSLGRATVTVTPNTGVEEGLGVTGLPSWDSFSEELVGLDANVQSEAITRAEGDVSLTSSRKVISGVETINGGKIASSTADTDPATSTSTSHTALPISQLSLSDSITGGGNGLVVSAGAGEGTSGSGAGSTVSTTAADAAAPCGDPVQLDGRPCSYSEQVYSGSGEAFLLTRLDLSGSGGGSCPLHRFTPPASGTARAWGARTGDADGETVKESVVRFPGRHQLGALCSVVGDGPPGWPGYWLTYDAGSAQAEVQAEAGVGSAPPFFTSAGTISYWDGDGVSTMVPPAEGGPIPVAPVTFTDGGFTIEISGSLSSAPSYTTQTPTDAADTADRTEARAVLGSPVTGTFRYEVTRAADGVVVADLNIAVDLGSLAAAARYSP